MSESLLLPDKYHIVWLDAHIGEPNFCVQFKRTFFTHVDPQSGREVFFSDEDIDHIIQCQSKISVIFDSFHFTLKAFVEEAPCLEYVESIQNHRILFIASSKLGESAVKQLLERYSHSFTNPTTKEPYDSIYIFCADIAKAAKWAAPYYEYVKIFNFETDLLARITRDMGEEFFTHGQQLFKANHNEAAIERLYWSKSLFIRHEKLTFPSVPEKNQQLNDVRTSSEQEKVDHTQFPPNQQPKPSKEIEEIDRLLELADERIRQEKEDHSVDDDFQTQTISYDIISPIADHLIVWLDELFGSNEQSVTEGEYKTDAYDSIPVQTDDFNTRYFDQLKHEMKACFSNIHGGLEIFHDMDECHQCIIENAGTKTIFLVMSGSAAEKILPRLMETCGSLKKIYVLGGYISGIVHWIDHYQKQGIDILLFDLHKNLLIRILQDISKHYVSKGEAQKSHISSSANSALVYFDWAKEMVIRANQLVESDFKDQLHGIDKCKSETEKLSRRLDSDDNVIQQIQSYRFEEDLDSVAVIFIVGLEAKLIHLASGIARLITCTTNDQVMMALMNVKLLTPSIVVSSTLPSDDLLSLDQLLYYYCFVRPEESVQIPMTNYTNVTYVNSIDHLMSQLYHKLGQYYRDGALHASVQTQSRDKAKRLLEKSTQCYKLFEHDTEKTLKRYAEMLKKPDPTIKQ